MAYTIEVKYFNSVVLRKVVEKKPAPFPLDYQNGSWPGLPWAPSFVTSTGAVQTYPDFPWGIYGTASEPYNNWYIEESRIKGGFNNKIMDLGVRAYAVIKNTEKDDRSSSLIFSGIYNDRTGINNTNVFSISENIIKDADPTHGSIQKLYAEDTNLTIFQENKVNKALINKNTIYSGDQGAQEATGRSAIIGQLVPYLGEYGISRNPESFALFGYRKYFADKDRSAILRLSRDGITPISAYGMRDYFRDELATINDNLTRRVVNKLNNGTSAGATTTLDVVDITNIDIGAQVEINYVGGTNLPTISTVKKINSTTQVEITPSWTILSLGVESFDFVTYRRDKIYASYDNHNKNYTLSMQTSPRSFSTAADSFNTLSFDENIQGWTSFYSYKPISLGSLKNKFYTFIDDKIYQQYADNPTFTNRCVFYGSATPDPANVDIIFNPSPSVKKNFNTVAYEGNNGWEIISIESGKQGVDSGFEYQDDSSPILSYDEGAYLENGITYRAGFDRKENRYVADIVNVSTPRPGEIIFGASMSGVKGYFTTVRFQIDASTNVGGAKELYSVSSNYVMSSY
tara:strand:- start:15721 stop:17436 length:1716 start_codon:yes stop_codon:yes gene_type:complete